MRYRQWWALLLVLGAAAALFGLRAFTGGNLYAAGITPTSVVAALLDDQEDELAGQDQADGIGQVDRHGPARLQRWRKASPLLVAAGPAGTVIAVHLDSPAWPAATPELQPPAPPDREPRRPRGP